MSDSKVTMYHSAAAHYCPFHPHQVINKVCLAGSCGKQLICTECAFESHSHHREQVKPISLLDISQEKKQLASLALETQSVLVPKLERMVEQTIETKEQIIQHAAASKKYLEDVEQEVINMIKERVQYLKYRVDNIADCKIEKLDIETSRINSHLDIMKVLGQKSQNLTDPVEIIKTLERMSNYTNQKIEQTILPVYQVENASFSAVLPCNMIETNGWGQVTDFTIWPEKSYANGAGLVRCLLNTETNFSITVATRDGSPIVPSSCSLDLNFQSLSGSVVPYQISMKDGNYQVSYVAREKGDLFITIKVNGHPIPGSPYRVQVSRTKYKPAASWNTAPCNMPGSLALTDCDIFICDEDLHKLHQYSKCDGKHQTAKGSKGTENSRFNEPCGLRYHPESRSLYLCDRKNHRIQVFDDKGRFIRTIGCFGSDEGELDHPTDIAVDCKGDLYIVDSNNKRIQVFDANGRFIRTFTCDKMKHPWGIAIDSMDFLYITDVFNHCIYQFDKQRGQLVQQISSFGTNLGMLSSPKGISIDTDGNIIVADTENRRVQVFDSSGAFMNCIEGDFQRPSFVTVDNSGVLAVSDTKSRLVQFFELV